MKTKILLLILIFVLLISSVSAQLTYDSTANNVIPTDTIRGLTEHNGELVLFLTNTSIITLNTSLDITSNTKPVLSYQLGTPTSDGTYIYAVASTLNPNRIYKIDPSNSYAVISYKEIIPQSFSPILTTPLSLSYQSETGYLLIGYGSGLIVYDYNTNTEINNFIYPEILSGSNQYLINTNFGDNFYIGFENETIQVNAYLTIVENLQEVINYKSGNDYSYFNGYFYQKTTPISNDLYRYTTTSELETNNFFINGKYWSATSQCINTGSEYSYIVCNEPTFNNPTVSNGLTYGVYCSSFNNESVCEGTCITTESVINGTTYVSGNCNLSDCTSECFSIGASISTGLTTYKVCGNYDNDICLEYGSIQTCDTGSYYRLDATQDNPYCSVYNYSSFNKTFLNSNWYSSHNTKSSVIDYSQVDIKTIINTYLAGINLLSSYSPLINDDNTYFKSKYLEKAYNVHSTLNVGYTNFGIVYPDLINGSGYASINCDHKEVIIKESDIKEIFNASRTISTSLYGNIITTSLTYTLNDTDNMKTLFQRVSPSIKHVVELNVTNKTMLVYSNSELIFNQTTANPINLINLYCDYDFTNLYRGCYVFITDGSNDYAVYETPISFNGSSAPSSSYYEITPTNSINVNGYTLTSISAREGFTSFTEGTYPFTCEILEGGQIIRTYQNNGLIPSYLDYKDVYLNVNLGVITPTTSGEETDLLFGGVLSQSKKIIYSVLISLFISIFLIFITSNEKVNSQASGFISVAGLIGSLIIFTIIGWLPVIVSLIMMILSAGIIAILFRQGVMGS